MKSPNAKRQTSYRLDEEDFDLLKELELIERKSGNTIMTEAVQEYLNKKFPGQQRAVVLRQLRERRAMLSANN